MSDTNAIELTDEMRRGLQPGDVVRTCNTDRNRLVTERPWQGAPTKQWAVVLDGGMWMLRDVTNIVSTVAKKSTMLSEKEIRAFHDASKACLKHARSLGMGSEYPALFLEREIEILEWVLGLNQSMFRKVESVLGMAAEVREGVA